MLQFTEHFDNHGNLFYCISNSKGSSLGELWEIGKWVLLSSKYATFSRYSQVELKQILDKLVELNGEED